MLRRIMIFLTSLLLLLNSALVNASIGGWTLSNPTAIGASILYDGTKGAATSSILISPNASQVAKVLRGGLVGYALTFAVEQLLGAVDWVLDPTNNQVKYKEYFGTIGSYYRSETVFNVVNCNGNDMPYFSSSGAAVSYVSGCMRAIGWGEPVCNFVTSKLYICKSPIGHPVEIRFYGTQTEVEKNLSLITAAQQVIENAESDNLDAQFAVLAAATNILSEAEQDDAKAKPFEDELERNADDKCKDHNFKMDSQAAIVEWRYNELIADRYNLFINNKSVSNPLILNGVNKGSWDGHVDQYKYAQGVLRNFIIKASNAGCLATPRADKWVNIEPPSQPGSSL